MSRLRARLVVNRVDLQVLDGPVELAVAAASAFRRAIASSRRPRIAVCLCGGSTPLRLYERLRANDARMPLPWARLHWFWCDERLVPLTDARSNAGAACRTLLREVATSGKVHPIPTGRLDADEAAARYESTLLAFHGEPRLGRDRPLFDLLLLGLGADGHVASLFPGSMALTERERWVTGVARPGLPPFVPRVTLTPPALASARETLFLVSGAAKRTALARVLGGEDLPATRVHSHGRVRWLVDRAACGILRP